ncbi:uncharacterized protein LOC124816303 [Hydra vulgaris]|uniref:uncharacterized protein LOC124816303 n=1 Tax=Hydra vulgaris TaxID=6087 RepID=UPI001F5E7713|nr:uncharacterized protein LOC124816303 [Hydra vulgaris]
MAVALSPAISKIFENILLQKINIPDNLDDYQFGFKQKHSTTLCTNYLKKAIYYYISRGSHVFTSFIDFNKAFDNVDYWLLFCNLLDQGIPKNIVSLLAFWYSNQECVLIGRKLNLLLLV